jgi:osmotically-inducible protein OsmY
VLTDRELKDRVLAELEWDPAVDADRIGLPVADGVVTVAGVVETFADKDTIAHAVGRVAGVRSVALELEVNLAVPHHRSDGEIAASAEQALQSSTLIPADEIRLAVEDALARQAGREARRIRVSVEGTTVKLTGLVNCWHDRETAEATVRSAPGVEHVVNELIGV